MKTRAFILTFFAAGFVSLAAQTFDPASVRSRTCNSTETNCGFRAPDPELARSIPVLPRVAHRGLPSKIDLAPRMPPVGNQGQQNSCVAWATTYAMRSFHEQQIRNWGYDAPFGGGQGNHVFSPAFVYNQINGGRDEGSVMENALELLVRRGAAPWSVMPYSDRDYKTQPSSQQIAAASNYKLARYRRIPATDLDTIKAELAAGRPVIFGMGVDDAFYQLKSEPYDKRGGRDYGGHAMALVGYDDNKKSPRGHQGAFKIINSWGQGWGDRGFGWISYQQWTKEQPWTLAAYPAENVTPSPQTQENNPPVDVNAAEVSPPAEVSATKGTYPDKIVVSWSAVQGAVVYAVSRANPDSDDFKPIAYAQTTSYEDKSVNQNVAYRYSVVAAIDNEHYSDPARSPKAEGYTAATPTQQENPDQVTGLRGSAISEGGRPVVVLNWSRTPAANSYEIARYDGSAWRIIGTSRTEAFKDLATPANSVPAYAVRGVGSRRGKWSASVRLHIGGEQTAPATPTNVKVSQGEFKSKIVVEWDAVPGTETYHVFRYSYSDERWAGPAEAKQARYEDTAEDVRSGEYFAYTVVAANAAGLSEYAEPSAGRANPHAARGQVLPPPSTVTGGVTGSQLSMSWSAVPGAQVYSVFKAKKGSDPVFVANVNGTSYSAPFTEKPGEMLFYTVRAKSEFGGESADSKAVAAFVNAVIPVVAERRISDEGMDRFAGNWSGRYTDRQHKVHAVNLRLTGQEQKVQGSVKLENDVVEFKGPYARGASHIAADKVEIRLLDFGLLEVSFNSPAFGEVTAVLERER
ncbi:MAG: hypothetical protein JNM27_23295 [Leptospirales bacterium]|nr:hypothetical protein [Leptospirales bacterium]